MTSLEDDSGVPLDTFSGSYENIPATRISRGDGTLTVTYRVQNGVIHPLELSRHFTASDSTSSIPLHGEDDLHLEYQDYDREQTSKHLIQTVHALPIVCMSLNLLTLLLGLFHSTSLVMPVTWSSFGLVFSLYLIPAAYIGGLLNRRISFFLTILVSVVVLSTSIVAMTEADYICSSFGFVIFTLYLVDAIVLGLTAKLGISRCRSCCRSCCISCSKSCCT